MPPDPFAYKQLSKASPRRLAFTARARLNEWVSRQTFPKTAFPIEEPERLPNVPDYPAADTAVTPQQMAVLFAAMDHTAEETAPSVEIGAYRGVTTKLLASRSTRPYFAVDPFIGYGGAAEDFELFIARTKELPNLTHLRVTSGEAIRGPGPKSVSFAFIDAVHDYVNVRFDGLSWGERVKPGGIIAFHDTDERGFAGVRRAVWQQLNDRQGNWELWAHVDGLVVLKKKDHLAAISA